MKVEQIKELSKYIRNKTEKWLKEEKYRSTLNYMLKDEFKEDDIKELLQRELEENSDKDLEDIEDFKSIVKEVIRGVKSRYFPREFEKGFKKDPNYLEYDFTKEYNNLRKSLSLISKQELKLIIKGDINQKLARENDLSYTNQKNKSTEVNGISI